MLDLASVEGVSPAEQEGDALTELGAYRPELLERPRLVVGTKADAVQPDELKRLGWNGPVVGGHRIWCSRARRTHGLAGPRGAILEFPEREGVVVLRPEATGAAVERIDDGEFRLVGRDVERVVALNDVTTPEALAYIDERLERLGVNRMLPRAGVSDGDVIWIGEFSFEYRSDLGGSR